MSEEAIRFLSYDQALGLVAAIQEEEDVDNPERRILNVYDHQERALCWFDFDEVMRDAGITKRDTASRQALTEYILHHIPEWVLEG